MLVNKISPAPRRSASTAHSTASSPTNFRPPWVETPHLPEAWRLASIATTMHWLAKAAAPSLISSGLLMAAVFRETLSAPARSISRMSFTERMPPPTVSGMKQHAAVRRTTSAMVARPSEEAVISRKTSSSACWASYALAHSTGSPASLRLMKLVPLTTLPSVTSRHGMILLASTALSSHHRRQRKSLKYGLPRDAF